ncbi:MAG: hypothetical protein WKG00_14030 [Polyangiaceae bacterium]
MAPVSKPTLFLALGLGSLAACGAAATPDGYRVGEAGQGPAEAAPPGADLATGDAGPDARRCPHGALEDPHHGFVRCLEPGEADGGAPPAPPAADGGAADAAPPGDAGAAPAPVAGPAPEVTVGPPSFDNGEVKTLDKALTKISSEIGKCVAEGGGLSGASGMVRLQFLVRARERAEGVEVLGQKGVTPAAASCVKNLLKNRWVGAPSADPVGVTIELRFKPGK